jgi:hypothetical protein
LGRITNTVRTVILAGRVIERGNSDYERAGATQSEFLECQIEHLGSDHPETLAIRAKLAIMLLEKVTCDVTMEV